MNIGFSLTMAEIIKIILVSVAFSFIVTWLLRIILITIYNVVEIIRDWLFWRF